MTHNYAVDFAELAAYEDALLIAKKAREKCRHAMRKTATDEATASLAAVGIDLGTTVLTVLARWAYQDRPVIIELVTCWSTPVEAPQNWQLQVHYVRATNAGQPFKGASCDWRNIVCAHPSEFGPALLAKMPLWGARKMRGHNASPRPERP